MRKIKIFPAPHLEVRIHVSEQMEADLKHCWKQRAETGSGGDCTTCSWDSVDWENTGMCELQEVTDKVLGNSGN